MRQIISGDEELEQSRTTLAPGERPTPIVVEWTIAIGLMLVFAVAGFLPAWQTLNTDFPNYYIAASLRQRGLPLGRAYEWIWFQREKDHLGIDQPLVGFMPNPPMCAVPMLPLAAFPPLVAKRIWLIVNLGFLALALGILRRNTSLPYRRLMLIAFLCILPLRSNFICGQYYVVILLLLCAAYHFALSGRRFTSGMLLAVAASLKLFPAVFLILFIRKRDWRSAAGLVAGVALLAAASIAILGWDIHRVWLVEVLPRALRGDIIDPYALGWSSFSALWHRVFLFEPQLNPAPFLNLPAAYALAQAATATLLLCSFLLSTDNTRDSQTIPLEWAAFVPLLLLLSSMPSPYHYCVLILAAIVAVDALLKAGKMHHAVIAVVLFALACAPVPDTLFGGRLLLLRLFATLALYLFLLPSITPHRRIHVTRTWLAAALALCTLLFISSFTSTRGRAEDFARRLTFPSPGYSSSNPTIIHSHVAFTEMLGDGYSALTLDAPRARQIPIPGDVLSLTGTRQAATGYFEQVDRKSKIVRSSVAASGQSLDFIAEGQNPVMSSDGMWLLFTQTEGSTNSVWLAAADSVAPPSLVLRTTENIMDVTFGPGENVIAAAGAVGDPYLVVVNRARGTIEPMPGVARPARYPSLSPGGTRLAFSRREAGSWQLVVRNLVTGRDHQLTSAPCNATLPSWQDDRTILYATDCGRGLGLTALARVALTE